MSVGLDIGTKSIKVVELLSESGKPTLRAAGAIGHSGIDIEKIEDDKELGDFAQTIKKLFKDAKIASKSISFALPETQVFTRVIKFPLLTDQEIASAVRWEAEEYVPIPIKEAIIQHKVLERQENASPPQVLVVLVAVLRSLVERYVRLLNSAGLTVTGVETELMAMVRSLTPPNETAMVVDFGAHSTDIAIAKNEELFFSRSIPTAGDAFTRAVAQALGISVNHAEQYKRTYGLTEKKLEGKVSSSLMPIFRVVSEEIKKAVHYYQLDIKGNKPSTIILSGGSAALPGATATLTKFLGTEVVIGNPFSKIVVDPRSQKALSGFTPLYSVAAGLALRGD